MITCTATICIAITIVDHEPPWISVKNDGRKASRTNGRQGRSFRRKIPLRNWLIAYTCLFTHIFIIVIIVSFDIK